MKAIDIIQDALELIGVAADSQPIEAWEAQRSLVRLNDILDLWATQSLYASSTTELVFQLTGKTTYSFSTDFLVPAPAYLDGGFVRSGANDYSFEMVPYEGYSEIPYKSQPGPWPTVAYFDSIDLITFYPVPASGELHLSLPVNPTTFADLNTDYPLQAGMKKALAYTLAEELAIVYTRQMPLIFMQKAQAARRMVKRLNLKVPTLDVPVMSNGPGGLFNVPDPDGYSGGNASDMMMR